MSEMMDRIRQVAAKAAAGPLRDARERPHFERIAAQSPFPPEAGRDDYVERFKVELEALTAKVYGPFDADDAIEQVAKLILQAIGRGDGEREAEADAGTRGSGDAERGKLPLPGDSLPLPLQWERGLDVSLSQRRERGLDVSQHGEGRLEKQHPAPSTQHSDQDSGLGAQRSEPTQVLAWAESEMGCPGIADRLRNMGIELVAGLVPNDENHQSVLEKLAALEVGLTGAIAGLADTGSILVASGAGRSRIASLLPPVHIALLPVERIYPTMHDWLVSGGLELATKTANVVAITGSSRTSDIELQLTLGMHGPKELHVVLVR